MYCQAEWSAAFTKDPSNKNARLVPIRISDVIPNGLLANIIYLDLFGIVDEEEAKRKLLQGVDNKGKPRKKPVFPGAEKAIFPGKFPNNNLPFIRNPYFTGREDIIADIRQQFLENNYISLTQTISGLGGIGKTQTALEYAYRYAYKYEDIWWINAETSQTVQQAFRDFSTRKCIMLPDNSDERLIVALCLKWLENNQNWLLIYDNRR